MWTCRFCLEKKSRIQLPTKWQEGNCTILQSWNYLLLQTWYSIWYFNNNRWTACRYRSWYLANIHLSFRWWGSETRHCLIILLVCDLNRTPIVMAKHGGPCVPFSGISTCGRTSRETVLYPQHAPLPTLWKYRYPSTLLWQMNNCNP